MQTNLQNRRSRQRSSVLPLPLILVCCLIATISRAEKIALFYNSTYIQISEGNLFAEGSNMLRSLEAEGHEVMTFDGLDAEEWSQMMMENELLIIPELERSNLYQDLPSSTILKLRNYVRNGGGLIICGVVAPNEANSDNAIKLLNGVFEYNLVADAIALSGTSKVIDAQTTNTHYIHCASTIANNNSISFLTDGLPAGTKRIYQDGLEDNNTTVALLPYHAGQIAYLGWGWWNAAPLGQQDNGWLDILEASVKEVACPAPVAKAKSSFTLELTETVTSLNAALLDDGSQSCNTSLLSISPSAFSCEDLGNQTVNFSLTDEIGRTSSISVVIEITDPHNVCNLVASTASINGTSRTYDGDFLQGVTIDITDSAFSSTLSFEDGNFSFQDVNTNEAYEIIPSKNDDPLNGVSTYDLMLISRHILDIAPFDTPYKIIAADVDNSGNVTTADIVELRSLILFKQEAFNNNDSWKFIQQGYVFEYPNNPLNETIPSTVFIQSLNQNIAADFIGIKIGDVDGSAISNVNGENQERSNQDNLNLSVLTNELQSSIVLNEASFLMGLQMTLSYDAHATNIMNIESPHFSASEMATNIDSQAGLIHISCTKTTKTFLENGSQLFDITFENKNISVTLHPRYLKAEAYTDAETIVDIELNQTIENPISSNLDFQVGQNQPNPFVTSTLIPFELDKTATVQLIIHNMAGQEIYKVVKDFNKGKQAIEINANDLIGNGIFVYTLKTPSEAISKRMIKNQL